MCRNLTVLVLCLAGISLSSCTIPASVVISEKVGLMRHGAVHVMHHDCPPYDLLGYGYEGRAFQWIWEGLHILRVAMLRQGSDFILEIQTEGDLELAKKKYGKCLQFDIDFYYNCRLLIATACGLDKAALIRGEKRAFVAHVNEEGEVVRLEHQSNFELISELEVELKRDILRIIVPAAVLPEQDKQLWMSDPRSLVWEVSVRVAIPPFEPVETKVPGVYFMPSVYMLGCTGGESTYEKEIIGVRGPKKSK